MELSIANHDAKDRIVDQWKERYDGKKSDKTSKKPVQEPMTINTTLIKIATWDKKKKVKEARPTRENKRHWFTLEELKEKNDHFPNSDVPSMLEDLLQKKVIKLPKCKRPKEMGCVNDLNYYHYH